MSTESARSRRVFLKTSAMITAGLGALAVPVSAGGARMTKADLPRQVDRPMNRTLKDADHGAAGLRRST